MAKIPVVLGRDKILMEGQTVKKRNTSLRTYLSETEDKMVEKLHEYQSLQNWNQRHKHIPFDKYGESNEVSISRNSEFDFLPTCRGSEYLSQKQILNASNERFQANRSSESGRTKKLVGRAALENHKRRSSINIDNKKQNECVKPAESGWKNGIRSSLAKFLLLLLRSKLSRFFILILDLYKDSCSLARIGPYYIALGFHQVMEFIHTIFKFLFIIKIEKESILKYCNAKDKCNFCFLLRKDCECHNKVEQKDCGLIQLHTKQKDNRFLCDRTTEQQSEKKIINDHPKNQQENIRMGGIYGNGFPMSKYSTFSNKENVSNILRNETTIPKVFTKKQKDFRFSLDSLTEKNLQQSEEKIHIIPSKIQRYKNKLRHDIEFGNDDYNNTIGKLIKKRKTGSLPKESTRLAKSAVLNESNYRKLKNVRRRNQLSKHRGNKKIFSNHYKSVTDFSYSCPSLSNALFNFGYDRDIFQTISKETQVVVSKEDDNSNVKTIHHYETELSPKSVKLLLKSSNFSSLSAKQSNFGSAESKEVRVSCNRSKNKESNSHNVSHEKCFKVSSEYIPSYNYQRKNENTEVTNQNCEKKIIEVQPQVTKQQDKSPFQSHEIKNQGIFKVEIKKKPLRTYSKHCLNQEDQVSFSTNTYSDINPTLTPFGTSPSCSEITYSSNSAYEQHMSNFGTKKGVNNQGQFSNPQHIDHNNFGNISSSNSIIKPQQSTFINMNTISDKGQLRTSSGNLQNSSGNPNLVQYVIQLPQFKSESSSNFGKRAPSCVYQNNTGKSFLSNTINQPIPLAAESTNFIADRGHKSTFPSIEHSNLTTSLVSDSVTHPSLCLLTSRGSIGTRNQSIVPSRTDLNKSSIPHLSFFSLQPHTFMNLTTKTTGDVIKTSKTCNTDQRVEYSQNSMSDSLFNTSQKKLEMTPFLSRACKKKSFLGFEDPSDLAELEQNSTETSSDQYDIEKSYDFLKETVKYIPVSSSKKLDSNNEQLHENQSEGDYIEYTEKLKACEEWVMSNGTTDKVVKVKEDYNFCEEINNYEAINNDSVCKCQTPKRECEKCSYTRNVKPKSKKPMKKGKLKKLSEAELRHCSIEASSSGIESMTSPRGRRNRRKNNKDINREI